MFMLPKPPRPFTGRRAFLDDLASAITDEAVILLEGIKGIGKTATMLKVANDLPWDGDSEKGLRRVFWLDLLPGASLRAFSISVLGIMGSRGLQVFQGEADASGQSKSDDEVLGQLVYTLNRFPCIFFVDNAQAFPRDELKLILSFFGTYLRGATFVFATSETVYARGEVPGLDFDLLIRRLQPLSREEARELFEAMVRRYGFSEPPEGGVQSAPPFDRAWEASGGNPMAMRMLANLYCGSPGLFSGSTLDSKGISKPGLPSGELAATLSVDQALLVSALMDIGMPVPTEAIRQIPEVSESLEPLERRFFLDRNGFGQVVVCQPIAPSNERERVLSLASRILVAATRNLRSSAESMSLYEIIGRETVEISEGEIYLQALWIRLIEMYPPGDFVFGETVLVTRYFQALNNREMAFRLWRTVEPWLDKMPHEQALEVGIAFVFTLNFMGRATEARELGSFLTGLSPKGPAADALDLAMGLVVTGTQEKARGLELLARACESILPGLASVAMRSRACVLLDMGDRVAMKELYERALALARKHGLHLEERTIIIDIATMNTHVGNLLEAEETLDGFLKVSSEEVPPSALAEIYGVKAFCLLKRNRLRESLEWSEKSMALYGKLGMWVMYHSVLSNHAQVLTLMERFDEAMAEYARCLEFVRETGDARGLPIILNNVSQTHYRKGDINSSVKYLSESLEASKKQGNLKNVALGHVNLAVLYMTMGRLGDALQTVEIAIEEVKAIGFQNDWVKACIVRADILIQMHRYGDARISISKARDESRSMSYFTEEALCLCYMSILDAALGDFDSSSENADKSVTQAMRHGVTCLNLFNHCVLLANLAYRGESSRFGSAEAIYLAAAEKFDSRHIEIHQGLAKALSEILELRLAGTFAGKEIETEIACFLKFAKEIFTDKLICLAEILLRSLFGSQRSNIGSSKCVTSEIAHPGTIPSRQDEEDSSEVILNNSKSSAESAEVLKARSQPDTFDLFLDFESMKFRTKWGGLVDLARKRAILPLLRHLAMNPGRGFTVPELYEEVWGGEFEKEQAPVVHVNVQRLRKLVERDPGSPEILQTQPSPEGENTYVFVPPASSAIILPPTD